MSGNNTAICSSGAHAVGVEGRRRSLVRLGLHDNAPVVPKLLHEVIIR
jgi:hypothetical protein